MAKQIILIIVLSVLAIMFKEQLSHALDAIVSVHNYLANALHIIFSDDDVGRLIQDMIALLVIPMICGLLIAVGFWLMKRSQMPHLMTVVWVVWMVLIVTMVAQNGMVTNQMAHQSTSNVHASYRGQQQAVANANGSLQ